MAKIKGFKEYQAWQEGKPLSPQKSILAQCYVCNGEDEGGKDCGGKFCPLYPYHPYHKKKRNGRTMTDEQRKIAGERLTKARKAKGEMKNG